MKTPKCLRTENLMVRDRVRCERQEKNTMRKKCFFNPLIFNSVIIERCVNNNKNELPGLLINYNDDKM